MIDTSDDDRAREPARRLGGVAGLFFVVLLSGCAGPGPRPSDAPSPSSPTRAGSTALPAPVQRVAPPPAAAQAVVASVESSKGSATPSSAASPSVAAGTIALPVAKTPGKSPASPAPATQTSRTVSIPPEVAQPKPAQLDLASLEQRLKDTKAIGLLTKITLKNQVDDLLSQFRAHYQGKLKRDLADLRRSYDLLILKVLSLLQDSDQSLAAAIATSREAIWGILSDPAKFAKI